MPDCNLPHPIRIGNTLLPNGLILAPMAGVTDASFRKLCMAHGADWVVTEMISAKALWYHDKKTAVLAALSAEEMPAAIQIFGSEPEVMAYAAKVLSAPDTPAGRIPAAIDINMGCPMPKIANNGDGSALMKDPVLAGNIIEAVRAATDLPVTVKIRVGWDSEHKNCVEIAKIAASLGVSMIAVHGRTRAQLYAPPVDRDSIRAVREAVPDSIPVIGNGDIYSGADALSMMAETGCDGVMIGRGADGNPWIFEEIIAAAEGRLWTPPDKDKRIRTALEHFDLMLAAKGPYVGVQEGRKHLAWYTKGFPGSAELRNTIMKTEDPEEVKRLLLERLGDAKKSVEERPS
ncbi:MAG: tRNA dihydrouridine synthase DusB [Clostridia bacterium]|nr:tRNA dihydrouridine synthase DusB [Clostridia bacterium]